MKKLAMIGMTVLLVFCVSAFGAAAETADEVPDEVKAYIKDGWTLDDYILIDETDQGDYGFAVLSSGASRTLIGFHASDGVMRQTFVNADALPQGEGWIVVRRHHPGESVSQGNAAAVYQNADGFKVTRIACDHEEHPAETVDWHFSDGVFKLTAYCKYSDNEAYVTDSGVSFYNASTEEFFGAVPGTVERDIRYVNFAALPRDYDAAKILFAAAPSVSESGLQETGINLMGSDKKPLPEGMMGVLHARYEENGGKVISASACGNAGAAVIQRGDRCALAVLSCRDGQWDVDFENARAACPQSSVYLDTDDVLILTNPFQWYAEYHEQFYFTFDSDWILSFVIRDTSDVGYQTEYVSAFSEGWLTTERYLTDPEGNILSARSGMTLPDVLTREEKLLSAFDGTEPYIDGRGYTMDDSMEISPIIVRRLFDAIIPSRYTYVDGIKADDCMQFIADEPDGSRVLLCCAYGGPISDWQITESTPLPAGTTIGIENFTDTINLGGQYYGVNIGRYPGGTWGVTGISGKHGDWMDVGPGWVRGDGDTWPFLFGDHPWGDIAKMDWASIPSDTAGIAACLDASRRATPNNPNPEDRLHLREFPKKDSSSIGKYYNGAPLEVLSREGEWTQVRVGGRVGYMMTKFLLTGDAVNRQTPAVFRKTNRDPLTKVYPDNENIPEWWTGAEVERLFVIGAEGEEWYLVWDPPTGRGGRIRQTDLWDGNG